MGKGYLSRPVVDINIKDFKNDQLDYCLAGMQGMSVIIL